MAKDDQANDPYGIAKLRERKSRAYAMGGEQKVADQARLGRLNARERIDALLDDDSFQEIGLLAHSDRPEDREKTPADGKITGFGEIEGRGVYVAADDTTVKAGSYGLVAHKKSSEGVAYAIEKGYPVINLGEAGGGRIPDVMGAVGIMGVMLPIEKPPRDRFVPSIATIMGECFGSPTFYAAIADVVIQVKGTVMAVTGAPVLAKATGEKVEDEELGGWELHARTTGQVDLFADDDAHCLDLVRRVLSYLPSNANNLPPEAPRTDDPNRRIENVLDIVPAARRQAYDMHRLIEAIADPESVLELKPYYDGSLITALVRLDGTVVGILANNPMVSAGAMGWGACEKATAFIAMCDSYHIPIIFLHDTPGFFVSKAAEENKMPLKIMQFLEALHHVTVPKIGLLVRKSYGMAHCNMLGANMGADALLAWPIAEISFMGPEVALNVVYGRKLAEHDNAEQQRERLLKEMNEQNAPWDAVGLNLIDDIIEPADTRIELIRALRRAQGPERQTRRSDRNLASWPTMF